MAQQLKTLPDASRDLISELPVEVKDRILECLPTRDAAKTALLSRHWNHVWLQHGRLALDEEFVQNFEQSQDDEARTLVNIINNILFSRAGPIRTALLSTHWKHVAMLSTHWKHVAMLSTHWKHVWLHDGRLLFHFDFMECLRKCEGDKPVGLPNIINHILLHRAAQLRETPFELCCGGGKRRQRWEATSAMYCCSRLTSAHSAAVMLLRRALLRGREAAAAMGNYGGKRQRLVDLCCVGDGKERSARSAVVCSVMLGRRCAAAVVCSRKREVWTAAPSAL
nr:F-box/FBD/LRR-repeat protein At1g13570-like [Ipomoea batatas]